MPGAEFYDAPVGTPFDYVEYKTKSAEAVQSGLDAIARVIQSRRDEAAEAIRNKAAMDAQRITPKDLLAAIDAVVPEPERPMLIGVGGNGYGCGKDAVADFLVEDYGFQKVFMSEPVQLALQTMNPWFVVDPFNSDDESREFYTLIEAGIPRIDKAAKTGEVTKFVARYNDIEYVVGYHNAKHINEVRTWLRTFATDVVRNQLGKDIWMAKAAIAIEALRDAGTPVTITGIRFENERQMIRELGGSTIYVARPGHTTDDHESDATLTVTHFDYLIANNTTLKDLRTRTAIAVESLKAVALHKAQKEN
jgi:hypothetical protein